MRPKWIESIDLAIGRAALRLPSRLQVLLSGRQQVVIDGASLHPNVQLMLAVSGEAGRARSLSHDDVSVARQRMRRATTRFARSVPPVAAARELTFEGPGGPLRARHYVPDVTGAQPLLVYFHGGGFALGDLDTHDHACRALCHTGRMHVLSVAYRLAPEHPHPAGVEDALASLRYAQAQARAWGADPDAVAIGGDSAGGNLSAVVAQRTRGDRPPRMQLLVYPTVDIGGDWPSLGLFGCGFYLTRADMEFFNRWYLGGRELRAGERADVAPLRAADFSGLAPALIVTGGFDPLRDEGEAYARALEGAGVPVIAWREPGLVHGFLHMAAVSPVAEAALERIAREFGRALRGE